LSQKFANLEKKRKAIAHGPRPENIRTI